jgi:hypothetical protein
MKSRVCSEPERGGVRYRNILPRGMLQATEADFGD